jgi:hypothetical protein
LNHGYIAASYNQVLGLYTIDKEIFPRDLFDLLYNCPKFLYLAGLDKPKEPTAAQIRRTQINKQQGQLDQLSSILQNTLLENKALETCLQFAVYFFNNTRPDQPAEQSPKESGRTIARTDTSNKEEIITARISAARSSRVLLTNILKQIEKHILCYYAKPLKIISNKIFFYRFIYKESYTVFGRGFGFCCSR